MTGGLRRGRRLASVPALAALALLALSGGAMAQDASPTASTAPASSGPLASAVAAIPVTLADFSIMPGDLQVTGTTVSFEVVNDGPTPHNLAIRDEAGTILGTTADLSQGARATLTVTLPAAGTYVTFCTLPGHESLGVKGTLTVVDGPVPSALPGPSASPMP